MPTGRMADGDHQDDAPEPGARRPAARSAYTLALPPGAVLVRVHPRHARGLASATRLRAEWTWGGVTEKFFNDVAKGIKQVGGSGPGRLASASPKEGPTTRRHVDQLRLHGPAHVLGDHTIRRALRRCRRARSTPRAGRSSGCPCCAWASVVTGPRRSQERPGARSLSRSTGSPHDKMACMRRRPAPRRVTARSSLRRSGARSPGSYD